MRTIVRVGLISGVIGFIALYALGASAALVAAAGILVVGLAAGLGIAKWLERPWFGRQLIAGFRTGVIACILGGLGALFSLLFAGPHDTSTLAARSHLLTLDLSPWAQSLAGIGWVGEDFVTALLATLAGIVLAALSAQIVAWSKNTHAIRVVTQARQAAQALSRDDPLWRSSTTGFPVPAQAGPNSGALAYGGGYTTSGPALGYGASAPHTGANIATMTPPHGSIPPSIPSMPAASASAPLSSPPKPVRFGPPPEPPQPQQPQSPASPLWPAAEGSSPARKPPRLEPAAMQPTEPAMPSASSPDLSARGDRPSRQRSTARPAGSQLTEAMRDALATWASNSQPDSANAKAKQKEPQRGQQEDEEAKPPKKPPLRTPAPSAYLNSEPPAPRRVRKKQDTDWLR